MRAIPLLVVGCLVTTLGCSDKSPVEAGDGGGGAGDGSAGEPDGGGSIKLGDGGTAMCGPVCDIFCKYGHVLDSRGCPTCACNPEPKQSSAFRALFRIG